MSGHKYVVNSSNLFDDDDVDDETFLKNSTRNNSLKSTLSHPPKTSMQNVHTATGATNTNPFLDQKQSFIERKQQIENRTLDSSFRSIGLLQESEKIAISTAEELAKQREQLEKSGQRLDEIGATLRFSQKHLNGLKSVFGGLKNYLSGQKDFPPHMTPAQSDKLSADSDKVNVAGLMDNVQSLPMDRQKSQSNIQIQKKSPSSSNCAFEQQLGRNLDEMEGSISRLKGLAIDLNQDIESQNELIDNIGYKVEDVDLKIKKQNKEMNHLLGRK